MEYRDGGAHAQALRSAELIERARQGFPSRQNKSRDLRPRLMELFGQKRSVLRLLRREHGEGARRVGLLAAIDRATGCARLEAINAFAQACRGLGQIAA